VEQEMAATDGYRYSLGIGETPWFRQATFSIWDSKDSMKQFAYGRPRHKEVIQNTRKEDWYSEEMFVRFKIVALYGDLPGALSSLNFTAV